MRAGVSAVVALPSSQHSVVRVGGLKMQDRKRKDQKRTIVGKCRTGKWRNKFGVKPAWKMRDRKMEDQKMEDRKLQDHVLVRKMQK